MLNAYVYQPQGLSHATEEWELPFLGLNPFRRLNLTMHEEFDFQQHEIKDRDPGFVTLPALF
jgi:hypothetical protein